MRPASKAFILSSSALDVYDRQRDKAVETVTEQLYLKLGTNALNYGGHARSACRADIRYHMEFLRPVLETGLLQSYVDYLTWLSDVLVARNIPNDHIGLALHLIGEYFIQHIPEEGKVIAEALSIAFEQSIDLGKDHLKASENCLLPLMSDFRDDLLQGDRVGAIAIVERYQQEGHTLMEGYVDLVQASLIDIGQKWQHNEISVAQEHLASMTVQSVMADRIAREPMPDPTHRRAILACVDGNNHDLGLRMVAHGLELGGWQVQCLGASVPILSLVEQVRQFSPNMVGLSVALPTHYSAARATVAALRKAFGDNCPRLTIGGGAINRYPQLVDFIGADSHITDVASLVQANF